KSGSYSTYLSLLDQKQELSNLPTIELPSDPKEQQLAFELKNQRMAYMDQGLQEGDILLCKKVVQDLKSDQVYVLVSKNEVWIGRLIELQKGVFKIKTDNPNYNTVQLQQKDIIEAWEATGVFSKKIKAPSRYDERLSLLEKKVDQLMTKRGKD
ncbi:S24 family peptidase, partial [Xanthovirga aplysinae]|uniref:S24 family peptidase n=1 Tax=Xanthovirga aplysinae TaxID=2529853 RepID=UPI001657115C